MLGRVHILRNICTGIATIDVDNATKNYDKIKDLGPYKDKG